VREERILASQTNRHMGLEQVLKQCDRSEGSMSGFDEGNLECL
jgi:hypothetical protein